MGKVFASVATVLSLLVAVALSPYVIGFVEWFAGRFGPAAAWIRVTMWVLLAGGLFGICYFVAVVLNCFREWRRRARRVRLLKIHEPVQQLFAKFGQKIRRFATEWAGEAAPDADALRQHMESDNMCLDLLRAIRYGPKVSLARLRDGYDTERELFDTLVQHYEIELKGQLRSPQRTPGQRISSAAFGAQCVDLLADRVGALLDKKANSLRNDL